MLSVALMNRLRSFETEEFGQGSSVHNIELAERELGARFPGSYKGFLQQFGWGGVEDLELYGLGEDVPDYLNLIEMTQSERTEMEPRLPAHLIPVMNDGGGNHYCLDTSRLVAGECPMVFWSHELGEDQEPEDVAQDFEEWLSNELDDLH